MLLTARAALIYFVLVFAAGLVLGPLRVLGIEPWLGPTYAVLVEVPILLAVMIWAARWVVGKVALRGDAGALLGMGIGALALQQMADIAVGLWLRRMSLTDIAANLATPAGVVYMLALAAFALMPLVVNFVVPRLASRRGSAGGT